MQAEARALRRAAKPVAGATAVELLPRHGNPDIFRQPKFDLDRGLVIQLGAPQPVGRRNHDIVCAEIAAVAVFGSSALQVDRVIQATHAAFRQHHATIAQSNLRILVAAAYVFKVAAGTPRSGGDRVNRAAESGFDPQRAQ